MTLYPKEQTVASVLRKLQWLRMKTQEYADDIKNYSFQVELGELTGKLHVQLTVCPGYQWSLQKYRRYCGNQRYFSYIRIMNII